MQGDHVRAAICAANNADWYRSMFAARGLAGERCASHWRSFAAAPDYHSNLVTLQRGFDVAIIRKLDQQLCDGWTLKDAFAELDLAREGFSVLFDATWLWREPALVSVASDWVSIASPAQLAAWESAWRGTSPAQAAVHFPETMLRDSALRFHAKLIDGEIAAGCISNRSETVVGLSNFFANWIDPRAAYAEAADAVAGVAPHLAIVGYERGDDLEFARAAGFREAGPLRVWIRKR